VEITEEDLKILDEFEGDLPPGAFRHLQVTVVTEQDEKLLVTTHAADPIGKFKPKEHYLDWIMKGVTHWKLPDEGVEMWKLFRPR
jgi:gamma-glutamylcyclotransferase